MNFIQPISLRCSNKTNIVHNSCCNIQATGPHTHAPSPKAARDNLLSLLPSRSQAATAPSPLHIIAAVDDLLKHEQPFPKEEASQWHTRLHGRWDLRFTTEAPLARLLSGAARPILSNGIAYQLVSAQSLQVCCTSPPTCQF